MSEEKITDATVNLDDMSVLNTLMHNIKGVSPVSTTTYLPASDEDDA